MDQRSFVQGTATPTRVGLVVLNVLALALAALTLGACSSARGASGSQSGTDAAAVVESVRAGYASVPDLTIEGTVQASGMPVTVWFDALIRSRDSLKIMLTGPFGIPVGAMAATPRAFVYFDATAGDAVEGVPDRRSFQKLLTIPLDYNELVSLLRGEVPRLPDPGTYQSSRDGSLLELTVPGTGTDERIVIDASLPAVVEYHRISASADRKRSELVVRYENFTTVGGRPLARRARAEINDGAQTISVTVDKARPQIDPDAVLSLEIPAGTPRRSP